MNKLHTAFLLSLLLAGCASERVILLPSTDGRPSGVVVRDAQREIVLDKPYAASRRWISTVAYDASLSDVQERFGEALASRPEWPSTYILYFESGGDQLTAESRLALQKVREEIARRAACEAMVIGHTDTVGASSENDRLSKLRAEAIRDELIAAGVAADMVEAIGRGEGDPLVPTADEVDEPKNRRVEINLR
jgi:outer membrane protein OmpA-like peptidoglycan-associated protein